MIPMMPNAASTWLIQQRICGGTVEHLCRGCDVFGRILNVAVALRRQLQASGGKTRLRVSGLGGPWHFTLKFNYGAT